MAQIAEESPLPIQETRTGNSFVATSLIGAHGLEHMYGRSFLVLIPSIYVALGLAPIQAGLLDAVRQLSSGITSMSGGFLVDMFQHRRAQVLSLSMALIGIGYFLVSISPTYALILVALAIASAGSALWHPPALGLLAQRFPQRRGLFISLHRSCGNIGDWVGPLIVGGLLVVLATRSDAWRIIMGIGTPILIVLALLILIFLRNVGGPKPGPINFVNNFKSKFSAMVESFKGTGMWSIFAVSAVRGMGDRALLWVIPLYLAEELGFSAFWIGFHVALLAAPGIVSGPLFGALSDRTGRKSVIVLIMAIAAILPVTMVLGGSGIIMTASVALFGLFLFSVNSLTQAAAIDVAAGKGLESTFIGLMWGSNAFFGAAAALMAGVIIQFWGWAPAFYFAAGLFFLGFLSSLLMPKTGTPQPGMA